VSCAKEATTILKQTKTANNFFIISLKIVMVAS
jgi:hypothetical protein